MKKVELEDYINSHGLLDGVDNFAGIYAITVDDRVIYVGQSKHVRSRLSDHIYYTENAMLGDDYKYKLMLSAKLGGHKVRYKVLEYCKSTELKVKEDYYINECKPCLNVITPYGVQNIEFLKVEHLFTDEKPEHYLRLFERG